MNQENRDKKFYLDRLTESIRGEIGLAQANLRLIGEKEKTIEGQLQTLRDNKKGWEGTLIAAEGKLANPGPIIAWSLANDFRSEVSLRRSGGDPKLTGRYGERQYGIKYQHSAKRKVMTPRLKRDGDRSWYENEESEIWEERSNREAFLEWDSYMARGLEIDKTWDFDRLTKEIEKFFNKAPSLDKFGEPETVFVEGGEPYQQEDGRYTLGGGIKAVTPEDNSALDFRFETLKKTVKELVKG
jgi:hypothetical protein